METGRYLNEIAAYLMEIEGYLMEIRAQKTRGLCEMQKTRIFAAI